MCQLLHNTQFSQSDFNLSERLTRRICRLNDCSAGKFRRLLGRLFHNFGPRYLNECFPYGPYVTECYSSFWVVETTAMVGFCKLSLWWECVFFSALIEMTCHINPFFDLWQWCNFSGIEARYAYSLRPQTYFRRSLTRVLNQFRNK